MGEILRAYAAVRDDAANLGVLSSHIHVVWSLRAGRWLGVGNDPRYSKSRCFDPFPFPDANSIQKQHIRGVAEELDAHRKRVVAEHPHLTLTGLYNVLEKLRTGAKVDDLDENDRKTFDDGLVLILKELHDRVDAVVADAYGWPVNLSDEAILGRLLALNKHGLTKRSVGSCAGRAQIPGFSKGVDQQAASEEGGQVAVELSPANVQRPSFASNAVEQTAAVFAALASATGPLGVSEITSQFKKAKSTERQIANLLASLTRLGHVTTDGNLFALRRAA